MFVSSLHKMEKIVDFNPELSWEGWDVVRYKKNASSQFEPTGSFYKGSWHKKFVFPLNKGGWSIPDRIGSIDV